MIRLPNEQPIEVPGAVVRWYAQWNFNNRWGRKNGALIEGRWYWWVGCSFGWH